MYLEYLKPVNTSVLEEIASFKTIRFGNSIDIHTTEKFPEINQKVKIAIIGVQEDRNAINNKGTGKNLSEIRKELYKLYKGNWNTKIVDLGNIPQGNTINDTNFALKEICTHLIKQGVIPLVLGGSQALTYPMYRAFDKLEEMVNLVSIDNKFDLEDPDEPLHSQNYLSKIVMNEPNNLFNFSNIGYQTFFNSQEEIDLLEKLYFESYRLGEINKDLKSAEPVLRDANLISVDLSSVRKTEAPANNNTTPNGFFGDEICAILRYAGLSDKVSAIGFFEYNDYLDSRNQTAQLLAQMIWYFIEGVNFRTNEYPFKSKKEYLKYIVPIDGNVINFYKSNISDRWWMEISHNNLEKETLIPCSYQDYLEANRQTIPERWWKTVRKL